MKTNKSVIAVACLIVFVTAAISMILVCSRASDVKKKSSTEYTQSSVSLSMSSTSKPKEASSLQALSSGLDDYTKYNPSSPINQIMTSSNIVCSIPVDVDNSGSDGKIEFVWENRSAKVYIKLISPLNMIYDKINNTSEEYNDSIPGKIVFKIPTREKKTERVWQLIAYSTTNIGEVSAFGGSSQTCLKYENNFYASLKSNLSTSG